MTDNINDDQLGFQKVDFNEGNPGGLLEGPFFNTEAQRADFLGGGGSNSTSGSSERKAQDISLTPKKDNPLSPDREHVITFLTRGDLPKVQEKLLSGDKDAIVANVRDAGSSLAHGPLGVEGCSAVRAIVGIAAGLDHTDRQTVLTPDIKSIDLLDPTSRDKTMDDTLQALSEGVLGYEGTQALRVLLASAVAGESSASTLNVLLSDQTDLQSAILNKDLNKLSTEAQYASIFLAHGALGEKNTSAIRALSTVIFEPTATK